MWFPLAFMSIVQTVAGVPNVPKEATISLRLNGFETLFTSTVTTNDRKPFNSDDYKKLENTFKTDMGAQQYISRYEAQDIARFKFTNTSRHLWMISSPQRQDMIWHLKPGNETVHKAAAHMTFSYSFRRKPGEFEIAEGYLEDKLNDDEREQLMNHIKEVTDRAETPTWPDGVVIQTRFPQYVRALTTNDARPIGSLIGTKECYFNIRIKLSVDDETIPDTSLYYWSMFTEQAPEKPDDKEKWSCSVYLKDFDGDETTDHSDIANTFIVFSDRTGPESLAWLTGYGIIGLYLSVTLLCGR